MSGGEWGNKALHPAPPARPDVKIALKAYGRKQPSCSAQRRQSWNSCTASTSGLGAGVPRSRCSRERGQQAWRLEGNAARHVAVSGLLQGMEVELR